MDHESLREKRRRAGRAGGAAAAAARAARAGTSGHRPGPVAGPAPGGGSDGDPIVFGTAAQLREMIAAAEDGATKDLARVVTASTRRIEEFGAKHPRARVEKLVGRPWYANAGAPGAVKSAGIRIVNRADGAAEMWICDEISWWGIMAQDVIAELNEIDADRLLVHLNSPGGDVYEGVNIRRALLDHPAEVYMQIDGMAASIASVIMQAGDTVGIDPMGMVMIHDASGFCYGNATDMAAMAMLLDKISDTIAAGYADHAGGTTEEWRSRMLAETWYNADEAIAAHLVDEKLGDTQPATEPAAARSRRPAAVAPPSPVASFGGLLLDHTIAALETPPATVAANSKILDALLEANQP